MTDTTKRNAEIVSSYEFQAKDCIPDEMVVPHVHVVKLLNTKDAEHAKDKEEAVKEAVKEAVRGEALWWFRQQSAFMRCTRTRDVGELTRLCDLAEKRIEELHRSTPQLLQDKQERV